MSNSPFLYGESLEQALAMSSRFAKSFLWNKTRNKGEKVSGNIKESVKTMKNMVDDFLIKVFKKESQVIRKLTSEQMNGVSEEV